MKRIIAVILCLIFLLQICACNSNSDNKDNDDSSVAESETVLSVEDQFNNLELKPHSFLSDKNGADIEENLSAGFLTNEYDFKVTKEVAEEMLKSNLAEIIKGKTTNLEMATACYDWLIKNVDYEDHGFSNWISLIVVFNDKEGNPYDYAYAYYAMLKYIGIDARLIKGYRSLETGSNSKHSWVAVKLGENVYFFDPFTDDNNAALQQKETSHDCFMKTEEELGYRYAFDENQLV